jgi:hypothetical protein
MVANDEGMNDEPPSHTPGMYIVFGRHTVLGALNKGPDPSSNTAAVK